MVFTAVEALVDDANVLGGSSGWGVWLTIVASFGLGGLAVVASIHELRRPG